MNEVTSLLHLGLQTSCFTLCRPSTKVKYYAALKETSHASERSVEILEEWCVARGKRHETKSLYMIVDELFPEKIDCSRHICSTLVVNLEPSCFVNMSSLSNFENESSFRNIPIVARLLKCHHRSFCLKGLMALPFL